MSNARITIVLGSVTPPGRMMSAVRGTAERVTGRGEATVEVLDLADVRLGFAGAPPAEDDQLPVIVERLRASDAVVFASPIYRGSFSGVLKNTLDLLPLDTLEGKPVGVVAMGDRRDHALGVERHLRDVLGWFGALSAPTTVYFSADDFESGSLRAGPAADLDALLATLVRLAAATGNDRTYPLRPGAASEQ